MSGTPIVITTYTSLDDVPKDGTYVWGFNTLHKNWDLLSWGSRQPGQPTKPLDVGWVRWMVHGASSDMAWLNDYSVFISDPTPPQATRRG